jgi:hypothetical protein
VLVSLGRALKAVCGSPTFKRLPRSQTAQPRFTLLWIQRTAGRHGGAQGGALFAERLRQPLADQARRTAASEHR